MPSKKILSIALSFLVYFTLSFDTSGQDTSINTAYEQKTIFKYGSKYILNGQKLKYKQLRDYLNEFEPSALEYIQYNKHSTRASFLVIATLGSYIAALTQYGKNDNIAIGLTITGFAANLIAIPIGDKATKHLQKSVWLYNRDILK